MAKNHGSDWLMGDAPSKKQLDDVEKVLDDAARSAGLMVDGIGKVSKAMAAVLASGLKRHTLLVLLQDKLGRGSGGRPKFSLETIDKVLTALQGVGDYVERKQ
jgi:hypothetical protein